MSSSFWSSSHCRYWLTTRPAILAARQTDLRYSTPKQLYCLYIFFAQLIQKLGKRLLLRQIPIATACVFFRRFYLKNSICETNPYLVLAACVFVAAKVEETPVHIKSVVSEAKVVFNEHNIKFFPAEPNRLGEMEFYLLEDLAFHLVIFHPYRALLHITGREPADSGKFPLSRVDEDLAIRRKEAEAKKKRDDEARRASHLPPRPGSVSVAQQSAAATVAAKDLGEDGTLGESEPERIRRLMGRGSGEGIMEIDEGVLQISWFILNDTYRTDVHLLYPPYVIALSAVYIAFCLTSMNNNSASRTRTSSSQLHTLANSMSTNEALSLPPPPASAAEFLAGFQVNLPILFACVQDIVCLYPVWETFEPTSMRHNPAAAAAHASPAHAQTHPNGQQQQQGKTSKDNTEKFGPEEAAALVRRMIEERMVDMGHPNNAGKSDKRSNPPTGSLGNTSHGVDPLTGRKRARR
ncbi:cyclin C [Kwoniella heveanensis BCC8398]|uniref:Cyclin C n=1 Tax=Kwoniella heveanensis BCC8398 TaxID=1296120 RepID=A0A1B9GUU7_9TREE|nr:cyclin C [Kwoniella heveanensis BCC8398]